MEKLSLDIQQILEYSNSIERLHNIAYAAIFYLKEIIILNHCQEAKQLNKVILEAQDILESYNIFVDTGED